MDPLATFIKDDEALQELYHLELGHTVLSGKMLPLYHTLEADFKYLVHRKLEESPSHVDFSICSDLTEDQNERVKSSINKSLSLITGGPGTGKTYTASRLVKQLETKVKHIIFAAPTGKAAQRLKESFKSASVKAVTLHRLLGREEDAVILPYDLIVVDEASMIDLRMMVHLLRSIKKGGRLILLGDINQLPPIDAGAPFQALVELFEKKYGITPLRECLRSDLVELKTLSDLVIAGKSDEALDFLKTTSTAVQLRPLTTPDRYPVLTPVKWGAFGVDRLNKHYFGKQHEAPIPIMILENNDELELYNGDIGLLDLEEKAHFQGRKFPLLTLPAFQYAYAISIHKSQGSEFEEVHMVLPEGSEKFGRNLLYTGITRAKKRLTIYADENVFRNTIKTHSRREVGTL